MKNTDKNNFIEIYCENCGEKNLLPLERSFSNTNVICAGCGSPIYWFSCPRCQTGYYSGSEDTPCPECKETDGPSFPSQPRKEPSGINPLWLFSKPCPWCSRDIFFFIIRRSRSSGLIKCPKCGNYSEQTGSAKTLIITLVAMIIVAFLSDIFHLNHFAIRYLGEDTGPMIIGLVVFLSILAIFIKTSELKKYQK